MSPGATCLCCFSLGVLNIYFNAGFCFCLIPRVLEIGLRPCTCEGGTFPTAVSPASFISSFLTLPLPLRLLPPSWAALVSWLVDFMLFFFFFLCEILKKWCFVSISQLILFVLFVFYLFCFAFPPCPENIWICSPGWIWTRHALCLVLLRGMRLQVYLLAPLGTFHLTHVLCAVTLRWFLIFRRATHIDVGSPVLLHCPVPQSHL